MTLTLNANVFLPSSTKPSFVIYSRLTMKQARDTVYADRQAAQRATDLLDNKHGSYAYFVKAL